MSQKYDALSIPPAAQQEGGVESTVDNRLRHDGVAEVRLQAAVPPPLLDRVAIDREHLCSTRAQPRAQVTTYEAGGSDDRRSQGLPAGLTCAHTFTPKTCRSGGTIVSGHPVRTTRLSSWRGCFSSPHP